MKIRLKNPTKKSCRICLIASICIFVIIALPLISAVQVIPALLFTAVSVILFLLWKNSRSFILSDNPSEQEDTAPAVVKADIPGVIESKIKGVTFNNDDGSSRQKILAKVHKNHDNVTVSLQQYEYNGKPAFYILCDGECVGNIQASLVKHTASVVDAITDISIHTERYTDYADEDDESQKGSVCYSGTVKIQYDPSKVSK